MFKEAKEKLAEKNMEWKEAYTAKTLFLKEQFEAVIGPGSYYRFEGEDLDSGAEYYCIVGPAKIHKPKAKFFAGVRKLPATYAAGGKYFDSLDAAAKYAKDTWGVPTPRELKPYTSSSLAGISQKVEDWKKQKENSEKPEEEAGKEIKKENIDKRSCNMSRAIEVFNLAVNNYRKSLSGFLMIKEALGYRRQYKRETYRWWTMDAIKNGDPDFQEALKENPTLEFSMYDARRQAARKRKAVEAIYRLTPAEASQLYEEYFGYHPTYGAYLVTVGPYVGKDFFTSGMEVQKGRGKNKKVIQKEPAGFKFGFYKFRLSRSSEEQMTEAMGSRVNKFCKKLGYNKDVVKNLLDPSDFRLILRQAKPIDKEEDLTAHAPRRDARIIENLDPNSPQGKALYDLQPMLGENTELDVNEKGRVKILEAVWGPLFTEALDIVGQRENTTREQLLEEIKTNRAMLDIVIKELHRIYKDATEKNDVRVAGMPPPPDNVEWNLKGKAGTQIFSGAVGIPAKDIASLKVVKEILSKMETEGVDADSLEDPQFYDQYVNKVLEDLNASRRSYGKDKKDTFSINDINKYMSVIKGLKGASNGERLLEVDQTITRAETSTGYDDSKSAWDVAKIYFTLLAYDERTKDKVGIESAPPIAFDFDDKKSVNFTSEQLKRLTESRGGVDFESLKAAAKKDKKEQMEEAEIADEEETLEDVKIDAADDVPEEELALGDVSGLEEAESLSQPITPEEARYVIEEDASEGMVPVGDLFKNLFKDEPIESVNPVAETTTTTTTPTKTPEEEEYVTFAKTIKSLIKIASELDKEGKGEEAEKIHQVIRKHIKRLK